MVLGRGDLSHGLFLDECRTNIPGALRCGTATERERKGSLELEMTVIASCIVLASIAVLVAFEALDQGLE